jgi:hypothetical protein
VDPEFIEHCVGAQWVCADDVVILEVFLILLLGVYWLMQTIERHSEGAPTF